MKTGVLASQQIEGMIEKGQIGAESEIESTQIQPASLDLRLGKIAYRIRASFLPGKDRLVTERLSNFKTHKMDLAKGAVLERDCVYIVPLLEHLKLPDDIDAAANAKSSTGRLDILTRLITDGSVEFDRITKGYQGPLYAEIYPRSFSVLVRTGMRLNQIRFRNGQACLDDAALRELHKTETLATYSSSVETPGPNPSAVEISQGLGFSVDISSTGSSDLVGYKAKPLANIIDLGKIGYYQAHQYWDRVQTRNDYIILDPGTFYILRSCEAVHIPPDYAAEMAPYLTLIGEFRVHYAGFFDPGFGHSAAPTAGARAVFEVCCHASQFVLEHGQSVGRLIYEKMSERPKTLYGANLSSNYQGQGLKLSKHFKMNGKTPTTPFLPFDAPE